MKRLLYIFIALLATLTANAQKSTDDFNPPSPPVPFANYFNPATGALVITDLGQGYLSEAVGNALEQAGGYDNSEVKSFTLTCAVKSEYDYYTLYSLLNCEVFDLGAHPGLTTLDDQLSLLSYTKIHTLILPPCLTTISSNCRWASGVTKLTMLATAPPKVTDDFLTLATADHKRRDDITVFVPKASLEAYRTAPVWKELNIESVDADAPAQLYSATISITTPEGYDRTSDASITWTNREGTELGSGPRLTGQKEGTQVMYIVQIPRSLQADYMTPPSGAFTFGAEDALLRLMLQPWPKEAFSGSEIGVDFSYEAVDVSDAARRTTPFDADDVAFTLRDVTADAPITDFRYADGTIRLGQDLTPGHTIAISATSPSRLFQTATTEVEVPQSGGCTAKLRLRENGHARIAYTGGEGKVVTAIIFDADGRRLDALSTTTGEFYFTHLPEGQLTAYVLTAADPQSMRIPNEQTFLLLAGDARTYSKVSLAAAPGSVAQASAAAPDSEYAVKQFDGSFVADKFDLALDDFFTLDFNVRHTADGEPKDVALIIEYPVDVTLVDGSVISNYRRPDYYIDSTTGTPYTRLIVEGQTGAKLCLTAHEPGDYEVSASVRYTLGGVQFVENIATESVVFGACALSAPTSVNVPEAYLLGNAAPFTAVSIYDGSKLVGQSTTNASGEWEAVVPIDMTLPNSYHALRAEYTSESGKLITSEAEIVYASREASVLKSIRMINGNDADVTFDIVRARVSPSYYSYSPFSPNVVTFVAEFDNLQPARIFFPIFRVHMSNGAERLIAATYDEVQNAYTGTATFTSSMELPIGVDLDYAYSDPNVSEGYLAMLLDDLKAKRLAYTTALKANAKEAYENLDVIACNDDYLDYTFFIDDYYACNAAGDRLRFHCRMEKPTADDLKALLDAYKDYVSTMQYDAGGERVTTYTFNGDLLLWQVITRPSLEGALLVSYSFADTPAESFLHSPFIRNAQSATRGQHHLLPVALAAALASAAHTINNHLTEAFKSNTIPPALRSELVNAYADYSWNLEKLFMNARAALAATCPDGTSRVKPSAMGPLTNSLNKLKQNADNFLAKFRKGMEAYDRAVDNSYTNERISLVADAGLAIAGNTQAAGNFCTGLASGSGIGLLSQNAGVAGDLINTGLGELAGAGIGELPSFFDGNYEQIYNDLMKYGASEYNWWTDNYQSLFRRIRESYKECKDKPDEPVITDNPPQTPPTPKKRRKRTRRLRPIVDPSGYVYEGVASNRVNDVTATIYFRESESVDEDDAQPWDAENYGQQNPLVTGPDGFYRWDVPQGLWQVRFTKEGYADAATEWLPVPPPQLDVNVALTSTEAPTINTAQAYTDGVVMEFSKYMDVASVASGVKVTAAGRTLEGSITALNAEAAAGAHAADGETLASRFRFTPVVPIEATVVTLRVDAATTDYTHTAFGQLFTRQLAVERAIETLSMPSSVKVVCGEPTNVTITATPAEAVAGKSISVFHPTSILAVSGIHASFDDEGQAVITLEGVVPGACELIVTIDEMRAVTLVQTVYEQEDCAMAPVASAPDGTTFAESTPVTLFTATEGATILYTLDGSCPCDATPARKVYDGPIAIDRTLTLKAMAVCEGLADSEVATYRYTFDPLSGIAAPGIATPASRFYMTLEGKRIARPTKAGVYIEGQPSAAGTTFRKVLLP